MDLSPLSAMPLDDTAHVIQVALTPVFLLSGIGTLLNLFNTRLARVSDHAEHVSDLLEKAEKPEDIRRLSRHATRLQRRISALDTSIVLGALGGGATCAAAFTLFMVTVRDAAGGMALFILFGSALACTVAALAAFLADSLMAWHGLRREGTLPAPKITR